MVGITLVLPKLTIRNDLTYYIDKSGFLESKRHISLRSEMVVTTNCISCHRNSKFYWEVN